MGAGMAVSLAQHFARYGEWRARLADCLGRFHTWLGGNDLSDVQTDLRLFRLREGLVEDRLRVAFVAEFSRGKSELINAIFFAEYGGRMLPSAAGRTTMCPTELLYDAARPPGIELLPIQTRAAGASLDEYRRLPQEWRRIEFDVASAKAVQEALSHVGDTLRMEVGEAAGLGFEPGAGALAGCRPGEDGRVEVPRWRHAVVNFPHPLLKEGLAILDTPGLNTLGAEPELTLSLLPDAHAVLFVLAADTGVTQSDMLAWRDLAGEGGCRQGRLVALNKIDGLWDELKTPAEVEAEIGRQAQACAAQLGLPAGRVFPVSAHKGLVARVTGDAALLARSRLPQLEAALSGALIPARRDAVCASVERDFGEVEHRLSCVLASRLASVREQLREFAELRGKNKGVVEYLMGKVRCEKEEFDAGLQRHYAVRSVFSTLAGNLQERLGRDALRRLTDATRQSMLDAAFSKNISEAMSGFFRSVRETLAGSQREVDEISSLMAGVYRKFAAGYGQKLGALAEFSLRACEQEIDRLEQWCDTHLNTMIHLLVHEKKNVARKFFDDVAMQVRRVFERAHREAEIWLKAVMAPLESLVREQQTQLKRRLESIRRIHQAADTLEERIGELEGMEQGLLRQTQTLAEIAGEMRQILGVCPEEAALPAA